MEDGLYTSIYDRLDLETPCGSCDDSVVLMPAGIY